MQAIYDALLLISTNPNQATKALNHLAHVNPNFLQLLKTMSLELKARFDPHNAQAFQQYERMSKHILVIFNRFVILAFQERGNNIFLQIQDLYHWMLQILVCQTIDFNHKKVLQPALTQIIDSLCFKKEHLLSFLDRLIADHIDTSSVIFIYLQSLLKSSVYSNPKIESIQHCYKILFHIALRQLNKMVQFYKNKYMDLDESSPKHRNNHFISILKQNEFILRTLCDCISFLYNHLTKQRHSNRDSSLLADMLLDPELAVYLSRVLKIETQMFDRSMIERNPYELRIIIASNLNTQQKKCINKIKCMCLATLKLILSMTDKDFNLVHTDKILLKELAILTEIIIEELIICSYENVISTLGEEIEIIGIVSSLFDVLAEIVIFRDIKPIMHKLSIQQIVRLTLAFMKTYHQEKELLQNEVEEYFVLVYYILYGRVDEGEDQSIDLTLGQFCMKKNVVRLIKNMSLAIEGFNSILMQLCCDSILLFSKRTASNSNQLNQMFIQKHKLKYSTLQCIDLQSAIFTFTIALENYSTEEERKKTFRFLLETVNINVLNEMELCRFFTCLTVHSKEWEDRDIQCKYYKIVEFALNNNKIQNSVGKQAFYFLERLVKASNKCYQNRHYSIFIDKILNDVLGQLQGATSVFIFDFITHAITSNQVESNIMNLSWVNLCLERLNRCISRQILKRQLLHEVLTSTFILYQNLIKAGVRLTQQNKDHSYPSFGSQLQQFTELINNLCSQQLLTIFTKIINQKQLINQQYHMLYKFSDLIFSILISNISLAQSSSGIITSFSLALLPRAATCDLDFNNTIFKLLYQVINRSPYTFEQRHYSILLRWMKDNIDGAETSQINLNRVCLILQQFYYFIRSNTFRGKQLTSFFQGVTVATEKKFLNYLLDYNQYLSIIEKECDEDIRKIKLSNLQCNKDSHKKFSITIIRLYNTILMNPNLNPKSLHLVKDIIKHYIHQTIPQYDLSVHFLALGYIINNSKNSAAVECFRQGLELLYYNALHPDHTATESSIHRQIRNLTKELKSPIAAIDPYRELHELVSHQISKNRDGAIVVDYNQPFEDLQIDVVEFIRSDRYTLDLVQKLTSMRKVNDHARVIRKIKRTIE